MARAFVDLAIVFFGFLGGLVAFGLLVAGRISMIISLPVKMTRQAL